MNSRDIATKLENVTKNPFLIDDKDESGNTLLHHIALASYELDPDTVSHFGIIKHFLDSLSLANPTIKNIDDKTPFELFNEEWQNKLKLSFITCGAFELENVKEFIKLLSPEVKNSLLAAAGVHFSRVVNKPENDFSNEKKAWIANLKGLIIHLLALVTI